MGTRPMKGFSYRIWDGYPAHKRIILSGLGRVPYPLTCNWVGRVVTGFWEFGMGRVWDFKWVSKRVWDGFGMGNIKRVWEWEGKNYRVPDQA